MRIKTGAYIRIRTGDLILTKDTLYQLSYVGTLIPNWCSRGDLNPQGLLHMDLNHTRLPISPPELNCDPELRIIV